MIHSSLCVLGTGVPPHRLEEARERAERERERDAFKICSHTLKPKCCVYIHISTYIYIHICIQIYV